MSARRWGSARAFRLAASVAAAAAIVACGKKGPPLAPLHLVPDAVKEVVARRTGDEVRFRFVLPPANLNGRGPVQLDRVEIYAVTVAPDAVVPGNRDLLSPTYRIATLPVKPAPLEGEPPPPDAANDSRPAPGDVVTFTETLTPERLTPAKLPRQPVAAATGMATTPASREAIAAGGPPVTLNVAPVLAVPVPAPPKYASRIYVIRGMTKSGRGGQASARVVLPLVTPPAAPTDLKASFTATAIALAWTAPADASAPAFNVYDPDGNTPLNPAPLTSPAFEQPGVEFGTERCFVVRTVETVATIPIESAASARACVTPADVFPPAAPLRLSAVPTEGAMNLSWQANTEPDLGGYVVLRGDAPDGRLQPLTPQPIASARFEDKTVKPGMRYVYAVVAVDKASPPNTSAQSNRVEETAR